MIGKHEPTLRLIDSASNTQLLLLLTMAARTQREGSVSTTGVVCARFYSPQAPAFLWMKGCLTFASNSRLMTTSIPSRLGALVACSSDLLLCTALKSTI